MEQIKLALSKVGEQIVEDIREHLRNSKGSTKVSDTIEFRVNGYQVTILAEDYLKYIDEGRSPGSFPPIQDIRRWIQDKGIQPANMSLDQLTYVISRSIAEKGIQPSNVIQSDENSIEQIIISAGETDITTILNKHL